MEGPLITKRSFVVSIFKQNMCRFWKKAVFSINLLIIFKKQILGDKKLTGQNSMQMGQNGLVKGKAKTIMAYP